MFDKIRKAQMDDNTLRNVINQIKSWFNEDESKVASNDYFIHRNDPHLTKNYRSRLVNLSTLGK